MNYQIILKKCWYWYGVASDINNFIKMNPTSKISNKFKKMKVTKKIFENSWLSFYSDLWPLLKDIVKDMGYKCILDIVYLFSKLYYVYLLKSGEEIIKKIKIINTENILRR